MLFNGGLRMKRKMIYDCDNTIGIEGCDVDDGLSLLFLLACEEADLLGVTNSNFPHL